ncbi:hypothetical protein Pmani_010145 [Petrolisthes manimaculis]|uniref:Uncharacterized protein n=1 Tax=Petrolisthes manimaculis TaxID=1843537 RepID=A0AAE1Q3A7_9EUCA|nr:hypothetical protein Pmani_010145 [Petrolisthes manimaculis]
MDKSLQDRMKQMINDTQQDGMNKTQQDRKIYIQEKIKNDKQRDTMKSAHQEKLNYIPEDYIQSQLHKHENGCLQTPLCIENTYTRLFLLDTGCEVSMISQRDLTTYNLKSRVNKLHPKVVCFRAMA